MEFFVFVVVIGIICTMVKKVSDLKYTSEYITKDQKKREKQEKEKKAQTANKIQDEVEYRKIHAPYSDLNTILTALYYNDLPIEAYRKDGQNDYAAAKEKERFLLAHPVPEYGRFGWRIKEYGFKVRLC